MKKLFIILLGLICTNTFAQSATTKVNVPYKTVHFLSKDGLKMTADYHEINPDAPVIILCHQANYSRGEYLDIAAQLNSFGFNCFAIDQRSGKSCNGVVNLTAKIAKERGRPTGYTDAEQDIIAGIEHVTKIYEKKEVILWGSSYSAALALKIAVENKSVSRVIAYSPGEYLEGIKLQSWVGKLTIPTYVTSSKKETSKVKTLMANAKGAEVVLFEPEENGVHGSKALWRDNQNNGEYWASIYTYLKPILEQNN